MSLRRSVMIGGAAALMSAVAMFVIAIFQGGEMAGTGIVLVLVFPELVLASEVFTRHPIGMFLLPLKFFLYALLFVLGSRAGGQKLGNALGWGLHVIGIVSAIVYLVCKRATWTS